MRTYADQVTVGEQNVYPEAVIWRPAGTADPENGVFTTWATVHAAALALPVPQKTIYVDSPGAVAAITAGAWDMDGIAIVGFQDAGGVTGQQSISTAVGCTFTNFLLGTENCILDHLGAAALFSPVINAPNAGRMRTGRNATWQSNGNTAVVVAFSGTGAMFVDVEEGTSIVADGGAQFEVFSAAAGSTLRLNMYDNTAVTADAVRGAGTLERFFVGVGPQLLAQANLSGPNTIFSGAGLLEYTPGTPANWTNPDPTNIKSAVDRIATAVAGLLGASIP